MKTSKIRRKSRLDALHMSGARRDRFYAKAGAIAAVMAVSFVGFIILCIEFPAIMGLLTLALTVSSLLGVYLFMLVGDVDLNGELRD